jgi:thioredoxin 1
MTSTLLLFKAIWCGPCKAQEPIVQKWLTTHPEVKLKMVDVDKPEGAAQASDYYVKSVPTLIFLDANDTVLAAQPGLHTVARLDALYDQAMRRAKS